ncbi:hypothetical protein LOC71_05000 [Rhodopirellula sp. JC740]|uniref:Uncharacterized protein n=1 Tax=Rhodopirellula halodulae TaxID=2894198 RepID=A0ABS8NDJ5_9BACT|nr:hypothetical protein [Rhodopirellula sp. JC740]MCC9641622.1 hypothetical protein [Rhodopirellula sp. JC740]
MSITSDYNPWTLSIDIVPIASSPVRAFVIVTRRLQIARLDQQKYSR